MAIKAGLVGVNPKGVDRNGMPIASGGGSSVDAYTKAQTDALLSGKVNNSQLTANSKAFYFAYDSESGKYGYKLDGTGDFIPFENAGAGAPGWNTPADPITTGLGYTEVTYVEGGYVIDDDICILDIIVNRTDAYATSYITGLPRGANSVDVLLVKASNVLAEAREYVDSINPTATNHASQTATDYISVGATGYVHIWGMYKLAS